MHQAKDIPEARPASTVVLIRDSKHGLETLLLKRTQALLFAGGFWVFPGGAIDPADIETADAAVTGPQHRAVLTGESCSLEGSAASSGLMVGA